jgi:hypothetical protein
MKNITISVQQSIDTATQQMDGAFSPDFSFISRTCNRSRRPPTQATCQWSSASPWASFQAPRCLSLFVFYSRTYGGLWGGVGFRLGLPMIIGRCRRRPASHHRRARSASPFRKRCLPSSWRTRRRCRPRRRGASYWARPRRWGAGASPHWRYCEAPLPSSKPRRCCGARPQATRKAFKESVAVSVLFYEHAGVEPAARGSNAMVTLSGGSVRPPPTSAAAARCRPRPAPAAGRR